MKSFNLYKILLFAIIPFIAFPVLAQSGSYTLIPSDLGSVKTIYVPANVPVKITCSFNQNISADVWSENDEYSTDGPDSWQFTTVTSEGCIYIYCTSEGNGGPYNFTLNWVAGGYSTTEDSYIHGNSIVDGSVGIGTLSPGGKLDILGNKQISFYSYNYNQSLGGSYGIYSNVSNSSGPVYGLMSYVYGGGAQGQRWAGYFQGGDVELNGGDLYQNTDNSVITIKDDNIGLVKKSGGSAVWAVGSSYSHRFGKWSTTTLKRNISSGTFTEQMRIDNNGNVGIGTITPKAKLDVAGEIQITGRIGNGLNDAFTYDTDKTMGHYSIGWFSDSKTIAYGPALWMSGYGGVKFFTTGTQRLTVNYQGKVGIGLTNPDQFLSSTAPEELLSVNGTIHAKEVKVDLNGLADFVFKTNYKLMPLHEVEQFVNVNNHLPEIPSAAEVSKNGLSIGDMQNKLLQKVEELTLYMIEQQKEIEQLKKELKK